MPITIVQEHVAFTRAHEVVLLVRHVHAVSVHAMQSILIGKTIQPKDTPRANRFNRTRMQIREKLHCLNNARCSSLNARLRCQSLRRSTLRNASGTVRRRGSQLCWSLSRPSDFTSPAIHLSLTQHG